MVFGSAPAPGPRTSISDISGLIAQPESRFLIAEIEGQIAGCCLLQKTKAVDGQNGKDSDAAYFGMFAIDPAIHGVRPRQDRARRSRAPRARAVARRKPW